MGVRIRDMNDPTSTMPELWLAVLRARGGHTKYQWCGDIAASMLNIHKKYGHMPFGFLSWRHYLNVLWRSWLNIGFVILPFVEPNRDWGPAYLINYGSQK